MRAVKAAMRSTRLDKYLALLSVVRPHIASSSWGMAEYLAFPLMMFLATPLLLKLIGTSAYGQWMLLLTFNGLGGLAGMGMGSAATKHVSAALGRRDDDGVALAVGACLSMTMLMTITLAAMIIMFGLMGGPALLSKMGDLVVLQSIIAMAAVLIAIEQLDTVFAGTLRGLERFDLSAKAEVTSKLVLVLLVLLAAWLTRSLWGVLLATFAIAGIRLILKAYIVTRCLGYFPKPVWKRAEMLGSLSFGKWTWAQAVGSVLFATVDRLLVGAQMGSYALAHYSVCLQLAQQVQTIPAAGAQFLFPAISRRRERRESFRLLSIGASAVLAGLGLLIAIPIAMFARFILIHWVGSEIAGTSTNVLALLVLVYLLLALNVGPFFVLLGSGRERLATILPLVASILGVLVTYSLVPKFGLMGAVYGRLVYAGVTLLLIVPVLSPGRAADR
jgi:O-antigen/teichoic acid export membrane protein